MVFGLRSYEIQFSVILIIVGIFFGVTWEIHLFINSFFFFNSSLKQVISFLSGATCFFKLVINSSRNALLLLFSQDGRWLFISSNTSSSKLSKVICYLVIFCICAVLGGRIEVPCIYQILAAQRRGKI